MLRRSVLLAISRLEGAVVARQGLTPFVSQQYLAAVQANASAPLLSPGSLLPPAAAQLLQQQRHYAQQQGPRGAYTAPAALQRPMNIRNTLVSSNLIAEPYKGPSPRLPLTSWVKPSGWKELWRRGLNTFKSIYTMAKCKKNIKGWTLPGFQEEALLMYQDICEHLAAGDRTQLRHLVTPSVFSDMKRQLKQREDGGWVRVEWKMTEVPQIKKLKVVHGRLIAINPKDDSTGFVQLTVRIPSRQQFAAYDRRGRLVAGGIDQEISVSAEEEHHDVHFESADAGASKTYPQQAGTIRKNAYIVIKGRPCKVADVSTSKTGKHGHAKCHFVGIDIFTNKKYEDLTPSSHNCDVPHVNRTEYTLLDVSDDGFLSLMDEGGNTKDHLTLPKGTDDLEKLAQQIKDDFEAGKEIVVAVLAAMGEEMICASKVVGGA